MSDAAAERITPKMADDAILDLDKMLLEETASAGTDAAVVLPEQVVQTVENAVSGTPCLIENPVIAWICDFLGKLPFETMDYEFMRLALLGLLIIAPMAAICGTQVVNSNMSFFSDAIGV